MNLFLSFTDDMLVDYSRRIFFYEIFAPSFNGKHGAFLPKSWKFEFGSHCLLDLFF